MTLEDYLKKNEVSGNAFAEQIGTPAVTVQRYLKGRIPTKDVMHRIYVTTHGAVTPNDFYALPELSRKKAS